ncbi:hypothetical protein TRIUR3_14423 [Triticum urartu]|uniref:Uncharacterized protein n=1 Tax=Triticum urartu TaxID=4572 RepID=M8AD09_TRIUA|nr:hypothetical protein TRIUR3_14423 [Triticum urartu]
MASSLKVATIIAVCIVLVLNMGHPAAATECEDCLGACVAICIAYAETTCSGICTVITLACQESTHTCFIEQFYIRRVANKMRGPGVP